MIDSVECSQKGSVISSIICEKESNRTLKIVFTTAEQEACDTFFGWISLDIFVKGYSKSLRLKKFKWDLCNLKKLSKENSVLGHQHKFLLQAAVNFPDKCPYQKVRIFNCLSPKLTFFFGRIQLLSWKDCISNMICFLYIFLKQTLRTLESSMRIRS